MHELLGALEGKPPVKPGDDYFLMPIAIHAVSEGDHELWDGATRFTQSSTLRHQTGDRVRVLDGDVWCDGVVIRQPANDVVRLGRAVVGAQVTPALVGSRVGRLVGRAVHWLVPCGQLPLTLL